MRIAYLMGRGHSGSTFLDIVLGSSREIESVGELISGLSRGADEICSCGASVETCPFWSDVYLRYGPNLQSDARFLFRQASAWNFVVQLLFSDSAGARAIQTQTNNIYNSVDGATSKPILLDSNKNMERAATVLNLNSSSCAIFLVRDPVAVLSSYRSRQIRGQNLKFLRREYRLNNAVSRAISLSLVALAWSATSVMASVVSLLYPDRVLLVRFESFIENRERTLEAIGRFLGADMSDVIAHARSGRPLDPGHNIGGNETRFSGAGLKFDDGRVAGHSLPWFYRTVARLLALPGEAAIRFLYSGLRA